MPSPRHCHDAIIIILFVAMGKYKNFEDKISRNIRIDDNGCWIWTLSVNSKSGYAYTSWNISPVIKKTVLVHRKSYEYFIGPIPDGMEIDHLCRNRACCNPKHLEPVTHKENVRRGIQANPRKRLNVPRKHNKNKKTHCSNGHSFDEKNTRLRKQKGKVRRDCRTCGRINYFKTMARYPNRRRHNAALNDNKL
jgi:hypothetical protein